MLRQNRLAIRISFLLIFVFAALGVWFGYSFWAPSIDLGDWSGYSAGIDWVETISGWGEELIQLLIQATSLRG